MLDALIYIVNALLNIFEIGLLIYIIIGLLISFEVVNTYNQLVNSIMATLYRIYEPFLGPIRRILPDLGPVDISPILLFILIRAVGILFNRTIVPFLYQVFG